MRLSSLLAACVLLVCFSTFAQAGCPMWRPCGPGNSWGGNRLIGQFGYGADFRPACQAHDDCLACGGCRKDCDRQFRANMHCACNDSRHPALCRAKANMYYAAARIMGPLY
ncbi:MAG: hypothetical protein U0903_07535 [Planctomycetales bacterium]